MIDSVLRLFRVRKMIRRVRRLASRFDLIGLTGLLMLVSSVACADTGANETGAESGGDTTGDPTGGSTALDCKSYCATMTRNCTGADAQYASIQQCQGTCDAFALGDEADRDGNTLGCRVYHADAAAAAPAMHCTHAGPGGAGQCGANCDGFCTIAAAACPGTFADTAACMSACAGYSDAEPYDAADQAGDSLACRLYHLTVATEDPSNHCQHILPDSPPCGG